MIKLVKDKGKSLGLDEELLATPHKMALTSRVMISFAVDQTCDACIVIDGKALALQKSCVADELYTKEYILTQGEEINFKLSKAAKFEYLSFGQFPIRFR